MRYFSAYRRNRKKHHILHQNYPEPLIPCRRRLTVISAILLFIICPSFAYVDQTTGHSEGAPRGGETIVWGPFLTNTTNNSTFIHWRTSEPSIGRVGYVLAGPAPRGRSEQTASEINSSLWHGVQLNNLESGSRYSYRIGTGSWNYSFMTFPRAGSFRFIVYGDTREQLPGWSQSELHARVAERIAMEKDCIFVIHTGDLVNNPGDEDEWGRFFEAAGPMLANTTFFPAPGNHEGDITKYQEYFGMPAWYNFTIAGFDWVILDSNSLTPAMEDEQNTWINQTLSGPSKGRFVFLHHPMYTSEPGHWGGFLDVRGRWEQLFVENNVIGVFSAHVHAYEHFYEHGIHYFTVGTGGAPFYQLAPKKPVGYRTSMENTLAYSRVTVNSETCESSIEVVKVADVNSGRITMYPPDTIAERIIIPAPPENNFEEIRGIFSAVYSPFIVPRDVAGKLINQIKLTISEM